MPADVRPRATPEDLAALRDYIRRTWTTLERSHGDIIAATLDPKISATGRKAPLYVPTDEDLGAIERHLQEVAGHRSDLDAIEIRPLPRRWQDIEQHGLLYLPRHYIVPGGSFNEMYGWDSYFIQIGLMRDGQEQFAYDMVENALYQVEHYGAVLNANRTYYLTRSQPPFLSRMVLAAFDRNGDRAWLRRALDLVEKYYRYWTSGKKLVDGAGAGLSRYYDSGEGPAPEVFVHEADEHGRTHYDRVGEFYRTRGGEITEYEVAEFFDAGTDGLTPRFFKADRAMRESGHDPSNRFGHFNAAILDMLPVDLNCLLHQMEVDIAEMHRLLGDREEVSLWQERSARRAAVIDALMWDERDGLYYDFDFRRGSRRRYPYVTTFFPLYAGIAGEEQAARVVASLPLLERGGGLQTSTEASGNQWDAPIGWAPMQWIAVEGLRRYGYHQEADRISARFLSMILKEFLEHNVVLEKYDVVQRESRVEGTIRFGYAANEIGFGWTNAAFVELYEALPPARRDAVLQIAL
ncbi:MAG TPA: trehalase family glycosidase [Thermoanaerobaculia bacterium]|nr:trehalase family glycosidase [Thermoanaerobaculia bacterium]